MADPAAVLAEALILLLQAIAAEGAVLLIDDLQWADEDTISVLSFLVDSCGAAAARIAVGGSHRPLLPDQRLSNVPPIRQLPLSRLTPTEVRDALGAQELPGLAAETVDQLVTAVDGLPLVLDKFVRAATRKPAGCIRHETHDVGYCSPETTSQASG